jgi:polar amino acid transport system substrate-binding protein
MPAFAEDAAAPAAVAPAVETPAPAPAVEAPAPAPAVEAPAPAPAVEAPAAAPAVETPAAAPAVETPAPAPAVETPAPAPAVEAPAAAPAVETPAAPAAPALNGPTLKRILAAGKIVIGLEPNYPPFEFKPNLKDIIGFDIDVASAMAAAIGVSIEFKELSWEELIPTLADDKIDIVISGMTKTPARAAKIDFSNPYFETGQVIVLNRKNNKIKQLTDINNPKIKVGVQKGTTGEQAARDNFAQAIIKPYDDVYACQTDLINKKIDVLVYDKPLAEEFINIFQEKVYIPFEQFTTEEYCFAVKKSDPEFMAWLNGFIADLYSSGKYDNIYNKWFTRQ